MPFSDYLRDQLGTAESVSGETFEAGAHVHLTIVYTAGRFGIDDTGSLKFSWRTASDSGRPQFTDPKAANYTSVRASNGAKLQVEFNRNNIRPWVNTLFIRVMDGFLREGDQITVELGDPAHGSPGYRLQTCCDSDFQFRTFVDAFATYDFVALERSPTLNLVPGPPARWKVYLPTLRRVGEPFRLAVVPEDRWGNPTDRADAAMRLVPSVQVQGLPADIAFRTGDGPKILEGLRVGEPGELTVDLQDTRTASLGRSNPCRFVADSPFLHFWGDLHGQSSETVGTNTVAEYFAFARDKALVDITAHQGNDFQITDGLWAEINRLSAAYDEPGRFVALPAYEWSGNTGMGGDRNVFFRQEGRQIRRSSSVLLDRPGARGSDCYDAGELFGALEGEDAVVIAHVGGRYADINVAHDGRFERAVEIHSCWGTFEWLLHDAFDLGHRVGLVCHSDDHKGRPGAAYPGASTFGAIGGLTCYLMPTLDRDSLFATLRARHHYGTTGTRLFMDVRARFDHDVELFDDDPALGPANARSSREALMGDIVRAQGDGVEICVELIGSAPVERVTFFNGKEPIVERRAYGSADLGPRIRVLWEGAKYRGRSREVFWKGHLRLEGNRFLRAQGFNLFNVDKPLSLAADGSRIDFDSVTTGNFAGVDLWLDDAEAGRLVFVSDIVEAAVPIAMIGLDDHRVSAGGLGRGLRFFRLPEAMETTSFEWRERVALRPGMDNPLYVRLTQEDGHQAWSSPIYLIP